MSDGMSDHRSQADFEPTVAVEIGRTSRPEEWWQRLARERGDVRATALTMARADREPMERTEQTVARAEKYMQFLVGKAK